MTRDLFPRLWMGALVLLPAMASAQSDEQDVFGRTPTIQAPPFAQVRGEALAWLDARQPDQAQRAQADRIWQADPGVAGGSELLDRLAATFALADERARALVELCAKPRKPGPLPPQAWLEGGEAPALERHHLRLFYGRWLAHEQLYDESLAQLSGLEAADVVEPASLLFYQSVAHHRLLHKEEGLATIARLLDEVADRPQRYTSVAGLMQADLKVLEDESLDHISRRMDDIRRRLGLGHAGEKVRQIEDGVIASLDKLIEELEKQQQQGGGASGGSMRPSSPMPDSRLARARGAGDVERRNVGNSSGWGDLPAKEREEALQQIGKDFPSHYRDVIEQYFRKLASEDSEQ